MTTATKQHRDNVLRDLTATVQHFDPSHPRHIAHFNALRPAFGDLGAAALVSQDAARNGTMLELTDPGAVASHAGWAKLNRVVKHGSKSEYVIFDFDAETKVGGRIVRLFTREQTVPSYMQQD